MYRTEPRDVIRQLKPWQRQTTVNTLDVLFYVFVGTYFTVSSTYL